MSDGARRRLTGTIILAAGESARLGRPKQLLPYGGGTLLEHAIDAARALEGGPVIVVLGAFAEEIRRSITKAPVVIVENPNWREGMGASLRTGLRALLAADAQTAAALITLCDQPRVSTAALASLLDAADHPGCTIAAAEYGGTIGVPAWFSAAHFPELLALTGAEGARQVIARHAAEVARIPMPEAAIDIDTAADFAAASEILPMR